MFVVLLRGINVGGHNKVPMAELRAALTDHGFGNVRTYIASGNVLLDEGGRSEDDVVAEVTTIVDGTFDLRIPVVARPAADWAAILNANPFADEAEEQPKLVHVSLCDRPPEARALEAFDHEAHAPDRMTCVGREIYLWYPEGSARSKLTGALLERRLDVTTTARNWSTMTRLGSMISEPS